MRYVVEHSDRNRLARTAGLDAQQAVSKARELRDNRASFRILDEAGAPVELYHLERAVEEDEQRGSGRPG